MSTINFSGYTWNTVGSTSGTQMTPGQCFFSNSVNNIFLDGNNALHLKIRWDGSKYTTSAVYLPNILGFGTYIWQTTGNLRFDPNVVFGMFTYDSDPFPAYPSGDHTELDIEFSQWGDTSGVYLRNGAPSTSDRYRNGPQFTVHPYSDPTAPNSDPFWNIDWIQYQLSNNAPYQYTHAIVWTPTNITFVSATGLYTSVADMTVAVEHYIFTDNIVRDPSNSLVQMNFWLFDHNRDGYGDVPASDQEVVINSFQFQPLTNSQGSINYLQPCYTIQFWSNNNGSLGSLRHGFGINYNPQVSNWNIKFGMSKAISSFEIDIPDIGSNSNGLATGNAFSDIDVFDYVFIWYGYTGSGQTFPMQEMFCGRIDTKKVSMNEEGYIRTFTGRDLGEVLFRTLLRQSFTGSAITTYDQILNLCGVQTSNQPYLNPSNGSGYYFFTAQGSAFDGLTQISDLDGNDFGVSTGSFGTGVTFFVFPQNSIYAPTSPAYVGSFTEGQNIFGYDLVREVADVKNDIYVFGESLPSLNSGSFIPLSKTEFTNTYAPFPNFSGDFQDTGFTPQWYGTLWQVINNPDSGLGNAQSILSYSLGYNSAHDIVGYPWPYIIVNEPVLGYPINLGSCLLSYQIALGIYGDNYASWLTGNQDNNASATVCTPSQDEITINATASYRCFPTLSTANSISQYVSTNSWYAMSLLLDFNAANPYLSGPGYLNEPGLDIGSDYSNSAVMLNSGDSITLTYAQTRNAVNAFKPIIDDPHAPGLLSGSNVSITYKQINQQEQWWVILGSAWSSLGISQVPTDYFACAVEAPALKYFDGTAENKNTSMTVTIPVGPDSEGLSAPNLRGQHTGSYKWTRVGNPDWYNIIYAGVLYEFKTPSQTTGTPIPSVGTIFYTPSLQDYNHDTPNVGGLLDFNIMIEGMYLSTRFQSHSFSTDSMTLWGKRPFISTNERDASTGMCKQEANSYLERFLNPITTIELDSLGLPYPLGKMYTVLLNSEPNLSGLPGKSANSFTMIENTVSWSNNRLISTCVLTNLPSQRYPTLFTNFHMQPSLYQKTLWNYLAPLYTTEIGTGPPRYFK